MDDFVRIEKNRVIKLSNIESVKYEVYYNVFGNKEVITLGMVSGKEYHISDYNLITYFIQNFINYSYDPKIKEVEIPKVNVSSFKTDFIDDNLK